MQNIAKKGVPFIFHASEGLIIICEVFKKTLQSFFSPSNAELKTVQCTVKRLNLRKQSEIRNFQKDFANYQSPPPLIDNLQILFQRPIIGYERGESIMSPQKIARPV